MMHGFKRLSGALGLALVCGACATSPEVQRVDLTDVKGLFVVVRTERADVRIAMEDRLVADLAERGMIGYPSHGDLPDSVGSSPQAVIRVAGARRVAAILVIEQVEPRTEPSGSAGAPARVSPEHPDLQALYAHVRANAPARDDPAHEALVEANLFLLQGVEARRFWSGVALTQVADGSGAGLRDLSLQIADALSRAQRQLRGS